MGYYKLRIKQFKGIDICRYTFTNNVSIKSFIKEKKYQWSTSKDPNLFLHLLYTHFFIHVFVKRTPADKFNYIYLSKLVTKKINTYPILSQDCK